MKSHPLFEKLRVFAPGPTPVPEVVLLEMARNPLHHRTSEFVEILARVRENLRFLFQTKANPYVLTCSGTGAMEATLVNSFSPGDEVLVVNGGKFGERWGKLAEKVGLKAHWMPVEWGHSADPAEITKLLKAHPATKGVLLQASETSTGTCHPVKEIAAAVRAAGDALVVVDAITALGVYELPMDAWGLDVVLGGSQKAQMLPPGLAYVATSERARQARAKASTPRFYFNFDYEDKALAGGETAWTPAVSLLTGLDRVLARIREVGLEPVFRHHERLAEGTRRGLKAMGLSLLAKGMPSPSVTAALLPDSVDGKKLVQDLRQRYGITIAEGQDHLKGKMFRLAHLGYYDELDMITVLGALEMALKRLGHKIEFGAGVGAAEAFFFG